MSSTLEPNEQRLAQMLRSLPKAGPSAALDASIRAAAHAAVASSVPRRRYWPLGGIAAALLAVVIAVPLVNHEQLRAPSPPAPASGSDLPSSAEPAPAAVFQAPAPASPAPPMAVDRLKLAESATNEGAVAKPKSDLMTEPSSQVGAIAVDAPAGAAAAGAPAAPADAAVKAEAEGRATAANAAVAMADRSERQRAAPASASGFDREAAAPSGAAQPTTARIQVAPALAVSSPAESSEAKRIAEPDGAEDPAPRVAELLARYRRGERDALLDELRALRAVHPDLELPTELKALLDAEAAGRR